MNSTFKKLLTESKDGNPIVTTTSQLLFDFPRDRISDSNAIMQFIFAPENILLIVALYIFASKPFFKTLAKQINPKGYHLRTFVAIHNLSLSLFSAFVAINTLRIVIQHFIQHGFMSTYCDVNGSLWSNGVGSMAILFYMSKYYEFIDTWILILKGKEPSFLQVYHHTGAVLTVWMALCSQASWYYAPIILNCTIHTIMYFYFFIKTLYPTAQIKAAKYLTMAQICQFWIGIIGSSGVLYLGDSCASKSSRFSLIVLIAYGFGLIALFTAFASKRYGGNRKNNNKKE